MKKAVIIKWNLDEETESFSDFNWWPHEDYKPPAAKDDKNLTTGTKGRGANRDLEEDMPGWDFDKVCDIIGNMHELEH